MPLRMRPLVGRFAAIAWFALVVLIAGGCKRQPAASTNQPPATVLGPEHRFAITIGGEVARLRLAVHDSERARGLMNVPSMPEDEGMLFVWEKPQAMSFYMRNCKFPQDIGFFDAAGVLREIYPMYPGVEDSVKSRSKELQLALEMNHGWFARHQVKPGATIDLAALREALRQRGYTPAKFLPEK